MSRLDKKMTVGDSACKTTELVLTPTIRLRFLECSSSWIEDGAEWVLAWRSHEGLLSSTEALFASRRSREKALNSVLRCHGPKSTPGESPITLLPERPKGIDTLKD